jgi:hypothetical protein
MNTTPNKSAPPASWAVRSAANDDEARALDRYFNSHRPTGVVYFAPKDADALDDDLCAGRFQRVVFARLDALLTAIWTGHAHLDQWIAAGVQIELADPPSDANPAWLEFVTTACDSLTRWRQKQRRRQIIAAIILSSLALAALAVLFLLVPPAG